MEFLFWFNLQFLFITLLILPDTLPSPRPPSVTDLPSVSIYDGLIPPDEIYSNSSGTPPPPPVDIVTPNSEAATNLTHTNTPIVEAFNYSVVQQQTKEVDTNGIPDEASSDRESPIPTTKENTLIKTDWENVLGAGTTVTDEPDNDNEEKQPEDVVEKKATGVTNCEINVNSMKPVISPLTNIVSIEDLDDDLSEDELYSPRTPKNFTEEDASKNDYFKIHDILTQGNIEEGFKETPSLEKEPESELAVAKASTEYFTNVPLQDFSIPPPLNDVSDNLNGDNCDDFGDFADFQDFNINSAEPPPSFVESVVPVGNTESEEINNLEDDDFDDFIQHAHPNENEEDMEVSSGPVEVQSSDGNEFNDFTGRTDEIIEKLNENGCKSISLEEEKRANEYKNHNSHEDLDDSFGDFSEFSNQNKALEFSKENTTNVPSVSTELIHNDDNVTVDKIQDNNNDDDDDFADFQGNQVSSSEITCNDTTPAVSQQSNTGISMKVNNDDFDDDDDDFGDFSTAEPVESKTPVSQPLTSQNISTAPPIATPVILQMPKNLNERISKILQVMFANSSSTPSSPPPDEGVQLKTQKIQDIPFTSIDAAKALEYQWLHSETRHAFIKSLGIDSRNIVSFLIHIYLTS